MFTNNYINFRKEIFEAHDHSSYSTTAFKNASGTTFKASYEYLYATDLGYWLRRAKAREIIPTIQGVYSNAEPTLYCGVYFGKGSTPATTQDYTLESPITSGLSITNAASLVYRNCGDGKYEVCTDYIVRNTTGSDITIGELGVFTPMSSTMNSTIGYSTTLHNVLMERTVLTEPVTIQANASKLITYRLTFNHG